MCNKQSPNGVSMSFVTTTSFLACTSTPHLEIACCTSYNNLGVHMFVKHYIHILMYMHPHQTYITQLIFFIYLQLWPHQVNAFKFQEWCQFFNQIIKRIKREFIMHHIFSIFHFWCCAPYSGFYLFPMSSLFWFYSKHLRRMFLFFP